MKIVITGSIGNIGKPLTQELVERGHSVTVITSKPERATEIEALGAKPAIGRFQDVDFLTATFKDADIVYLMEAWEGIGSIFDKEFDFVAAFNTIGQTYKAAVEKSNIERVVHLSSIGAHTDKGTGSLFLHNCVENILKQLPENVSIKFVRPPSFFTNTFRFLPTIKAKGAIFNTYGGDDKEPWVSPLDIASFIAEEMEKPFQGRTAHYVASEELSPNEVAHIVGEAIGMPELKWIVVPEEQMRSQMIAAGMNAWIADGFIGMQAAQANGSLYHDFYRNKPVFGKRKLTDLANELALTYHKL
ncbi:MAG TPA: NAD(P)H-binding protein [Pedobacter sp.]